VEKKLAHAIKVVMEPTALSILSFTSPYHESFFVIRTLRCALKFFTFECRLHPIQQMSPLPQISGEEIRLKKKCLPHYISDLSCQQDNIVLSVDCLMLAD